MECRTFIRTALAGTAALTSTGMGLLLGACGGQLQYRTDIINTTDKPFTGYPFDPVRAENFTNSLFIPGNDGLFGVLNVTDTPLTLKAQAKTFPILGGKASPFLVYDNNDAGKSFHNPIFRLKASVTVEVTPLELSKEAKTWNFAVAFTTHSGNLDQDLTKVTVLTDDQGNVYQPTVWEGSPPGGHHRSGTLRFNPINPTPKFIELKVKDVGGVPERSFKWNLETF